jgi:hypothetical protein
MMLYSDSTKYPFERLVYSDSRFCRMAMQRPYRVVPILATLPLFMISAGADVFSSFIHSNNLPFMSKSATFGAPSCLRSDFEWLSNIIDM